MRPVPLTSGEDPAHRLDSVRLDSRELPEFVESVLGVVDQIPPGMVLSYGDIAEILGRGGPRQIGAVMSRYGASVSWWRVIRANGEAPEDLRDEALEHWRAEGTSLVRGSLAGRRVDMRLARWDGEGLAAAGPR